MHHIPKENTMRNVQNSQIFNVVVQISRNEETCRLVRSEVNYRNLHISTEGRETAESGMQATEKLRPLLITTTVMISVIIMIKNTHATHICVHSHSFFLEVQVPHQKQKK